jgi:hypothetical protein
MVRNRCGLKNTDVLGVNIRIYKWAFAKFRIE